MTDSFEIRGLLPVFSDLGSGLNALETLFNFYDLKDPILSEDMGMMEVVKKNGFEVNTLPKGFESVKDTVSGGTPVLVKLYDNKKLRYAIVCGWNREQVKLLQSGNFNWMHLGDFEAAWTGEAVTVTPDNEDFKREHDFKNTVFMERKAHA